MTITDKRKEVIDFTDFYYDGPSVMIGSADDTTKIDYANPDSLKGKVIGVQTATIHADFIQKYFGSAAEVKLYDTLDNGLADLAAGRLDYVSESLNTLTPFLKSDQGKGFKVVTTHPQDPIFGYGVGGGVRKDDTALKETLNGALKQVSTSGKWDEITNKYPELVGQMTKPTY
jgi:polar amino acid transport system substrate-binding protein